MTPAQINQLNRDFWSKQYAVTEELLKDEALLAHAVRQLQDEATRGVPIYWHKPVECHLRDADEMRRDLDAKKARHAAAASRRDALRQKIVEILQGEPGISCKLLLRRLEKAVKPQGPILAVGDDTIEFIDRGRKREAKITGLKDRLSRARSAQDSR